MNKKIYTIALGIVYITFIAYTIFTVPHSLSLLELSDSFLSATGYTNLIINAVICFLLLPFNKFYKLTHALS